MEKPVSTIKPSDINANNHLWGAFGHTQAEVSAGWIVRYCQAHGDDWGSFRFEEIDAFYRQRCVSAGLPFGFNGLLGGQTERQYGGSFHTFGGAFVLKDPKGLYHVSEEFVARCYKAAPHDGNVRRQSAEAR